MHELNDLCSLTTYAHARTPVSVPLCPAPVTCRFLWQHIHVLGTGMLLLVVVKSTLIALVVRAYGPSWRTAWAVGLSLGHVGEFAFILLSMAAQLKIVTSQVRAGACESAHASRGEGGYVHGCPAQDCELAGVCWCMWECAYKSMWLGGCFSMAAQLKIVTLHVRVQVCVCFGEALALEAPTEHTGL